MGTKGKNEKTPETDSVNLSALFDLSKIEGFQLKKETEDYIYDTENRGNGTLDIPRFLNGNAKCWRHPVPQQEQSDKKRKIILNNWEFMFFVTDDKDKKLELIILEKMILEYEVNLWQGEPPSLKKISGVQELIELCARQSPSPSEPIKPYLQKNHLPLDDYLIVGYGEWIDIAKTVFQQFDSLINALILKTNKKNIALSNLSDIVSNVSNSNARIKEMDKTTINLENVNLIDFPPETLKKISACFSPFQPVTTVAIGNGFLIEDILHLLKNPFLKKLELKRQNITKEQLEKIISAVPETLQTLSLPQDVTLFLENLSPESSKKLKNLKEIVLTDFSDTINDEARFRSETLLKKTRNTGSKNTFFEMDINLLKTSSKSLSFEEVKKYLPKEQHSEINEIEFNLQKEKLASMTEGELKLLLKGEKDEPNFYTFHDYKNIKMSQAKKPYQEPLARKNDIYEENISRAFNEGEIDGEKQLLKILSENIYPKKLDFSEFGEVMSWEDHYELFKSLKNVTSLNLSRNSLSANELEEILSLSPQLRNINMTSARIDWNDYNIDDIEKYQSIAKLNLSEIALSPEQFEYFLLKFPNLISLSYSCETWQKREFENIIQNIQEEGGLSSLSFTEQTKKQNAIEETSDFDIDYPANSQPESRANYRPSFDTKTKTPEDETLSAKIIFIDNEKKNVEPSLYRLSVLKDYFETEKKTENIELIKNTPLLDQEQLFVQLRKSNDSTFLGQDKLTIDKETWQPLPSLKGDKNPCFYKPSITHLENIQGVILGYEKETGLHYVKLDKNFKRDSKTVSLHYLLDTNPHDLSKDSTYEFKKSPTNESLEKLKIIKESLSTSSIDSLESDISAPNKYNDFLNFLEIITTEKDLIPLIEHIKKYFKHFKNEDLEKDLNLSFLAKQLGLEPTALLILTQRKGACRHRANALAYLFDLLGFKNVCIEKNDVHSFISFYDESTESHLTLDLGGHPCTLDLKPFEIKKKVVIPPKTENPDDENIHANPFKTETAKTIDEFWESRLSTKKAQLMWAESSLSARSIYTSLLKHLKENKSPLEGHTLYIDSAESLQQLLSDISINNDGTYKKVIGPLAKLIEGAKKTGQPALLLINWAQFSAKDIALYKSMMDDIRKIGPLLLPDCVQILGVTSPEAPKTDAFLSRIQEDKHVLFPLALLQAKEISKETKAPTDCLEINLFNSPDWRSHLLGRIGIDGKKFIWNDGLLTKAIKEKKSIVIKNPPQNNKEFDLFVYQLLNERKFQINGEEINVTDSFNIPYENKPYLFDTKNISFSITESLKDTYYLNQSTFSQFLQYIHINTKGEGENVDGYLAQYKDGDIIKVTETLSDAQWAQLLDAIEKKKTDFKFQFMISGGVTMPEAFNVKATELKNAENLDILESPKHSFFATSSDPGYTTQLLQEKLNIPSGNVIHLSKKMSQSDFFECISVTMESEKGLSFHRELRPVYEKLKKGESVILSGSCSQTLYNQLSSLFGEPPGIWLNGEYHTLPGKLIIISPEKNALKTATHFKHVVPLSEYKRYFENKYSAEDIGKAYTFFDLMQKLPPITDKSGPSTPVITAQRFKMLLEALKNNKNSPAKQIILHDYRGESYVIRNVLAKLIFSDKKHEQKINTEKLKSLLEDMPAGNYSDANLFKLMNCFSGNIIRDNFLNYKDFPKISEEEKLNFHSVINSLFPKNNPSELKALVPAQSSFKLNPVEKRQHLLEDAIDHPEHKIIFLKGGPGTGKTHTLSSQLKNITDVTLYNSEDALEKFLEDKNTDSKKIILFLDEANINPEDYWNLLKGLKKSPPSVFYKGKIYPLTQEHKIVLTGNPEDFTNRNYLDIQDITYTIGFRPLRIDFLKKEIVAPLLKKEKFTFDTTISSELMLRAYHDLQTCMPYRTFSARDIESMVIRYIKLCKNKNPEEEEQAQRRIACIAIAETFRKHFETEEKLLEWINKLADTTFSLSDIALVKQRVEIKTDESYVVVPSRQKIIDSIHFNIDMLKTEGKGKRGILLEGPSGVGKSALALYCLKNENKEIVHINAGEEDDETITEKLIDALHEGKFVILDEYNIKPLEHILNHILSGVDPDGNPAKKPGFYIILTGNPATTHQGHKELSEAELNRLDIEHVKPHTHQELCEIAKIKYGIEEKQASALIKEAKKTFWSTDRSSFYAFEKYAEEHPEKLKEKKPELTENFSPLKKE